MTDATWFGSLASNSFNNGANWSSGVVPNGTATFGASSFTSISIAAPTILDTFRFTSGTPYTFTVTSDLMFNTVVGSVGLVTFNVTGTTFTVTGQSLGNGIVNFGSGAVGDLSITNSTGTRISVDATSSVTFHNTASIGSLTGAGNVSLQMGAGGSLTINPLATSSVFSGVISGAAKLHLSGFNQTLAGDNTYTGGTLIDGINGFLQLGNGGTTGSVQGDIVDNGVLVLNRSDVATLNNAVSGTGYLQQAGTGTTILAGANTYARGTMITAGTLKLANAAALPTTGWLSISNDGVFDLNGNSVSVGGLDGSGGNGGEILLNGGTLTTDFASNSPSIPGSGGSGGFVKSLISGSGGLVKRGAGLLLLYNSNNSFSGGITVEGGRVAAPYSIDAFGTGTITLNGGILEWTSPENVDISARLAPLGPNGGGIANDSDATFATVLSGTGRLTVLGQHTLTLATANTYSGGTTLFFNTLKIFGDAALGNAAGDLQFGGTPPPGSGFSAYYGATLETTQSFSSSRAVTLGIVNPAAGGNSTFSPDAGTTLTWNGVIGGPGLLAKAGAGTMILNAAETCTGGTLVSAGTLQLAAGATLSSAGALDVEGGTFDLNGNAQTVSGLLGGGTVLLGSGTLTVNSSASTAFGGTISGSGALVKQGAGRLILWGTNSYTGGTTIAAGSELQIGASGTTGSVAGNIIDNGTLFFSRSDALAVVGVISGTGAVRQDGLGTTTLTGDNFYSGGTTISGGTLQVGNGGTSGTLGSGAITDNGSLSLNRSDDLTLGQIISGTGSVKQIGTGTTTLTAANTYTGSTTVTAGVLRLGAGGSLAAVTALVLSGSSVSAATFDVVAQSLTIGTLSGTGGTIALAGGTLSALSTLTVGAPLRVLGSGTVQSMVDGAGALVAAGGLLEFQAAVDPTTASAIRVGLASGTVLKFDSIVGTSSVHPTVTFLGGTSLLDLSSTTLPNFHGLLSGFATGQGIKITDSASATLDGSGTLLTVYNAAHSALGTLAFTSSYSGHSFTVTNNIVSVQDGTTIIGTDGNDILEGGPDTDYLYGQGGNDILIGHAAGAAGANQLWGGTGSDTASYAGTTGTVYADLTALASYVDGALVDQMNSIENLLGGSGTNTLVGAGGANVLTGGAGIDYLYGQGGDDTLLGGAAPAGSTNQLWGGTGNDTASYAGTTGTVYADLAAQAGYVGGVLVDQMNSIENLIGGAGTNTLVGDGGSNVLRGGAGIDYLYGQDGDDTLIGGGAPSGSTNQLWGGTGSDTASYAGTTGTVYADLGTQAGYVGGVLVDQMNSIEDLVGGSNADTLVGDGGANRLTGGGGADALWGKGGADAFVYTAYGDSNLVSGYDTIADFVSGTSKLDLSAFATNASHVVIQSDAQSTSLYLEQTPGSFNASTDLVISFAGANAVTAGDIIF